jgi:hypothetical protein
MATFAIRLAACAGAFDAGFADGRPCGLTYSRPMMRSTIARSAAVIAAVAVPAVVMTVHPPAIARADSCTDSAANLPLALESGPCADVLSQEQRWLTAITGGDRATVESILGPTFKHINSEGKLLDRAQEIASMEKLSFTMNPSDQLVDIAGDTAVIHGVNTLIDTGKVLARERFTDVFVLQGGMWMALSAQETTL